MGIRLYYSNETERLAAKLAANVREELKTGDPFRPATIIIPNKNLEQWLKMEIARQNGVFANTVFPFLEKGLWDLLAAADGRGEKPGLLDEPTIRLLILSQLLHIASDDAELALFRRYLHESDGKVAVDHYRKAWQLAEKLGKLFREYEYNREEMIGAWLAGKSYAAELAGRDRAPGANLIAMERCQAALYRRLFAPGGERDRAARSGAGMLLTLPQYMHLATAGASLHAPAGDTRVVHIFGLSQISPFHIRLLFALGRVFDIRLYQINVCSEFWEDLETKQEERYRKFKALKTGLTDVGERLPDHARDNRLLRLWGMPGRENVKLLSDLEEACAGKVEFESGWQPGAKEGRRDPTVLELVQDRVLLRSDDGMRRAQDRSIQIVGCPGIRREVETVYQSIIDNMRRDPSLNLTDIAVLVPAMRTYAPVIKAVFGGAERLVPYNMSDAAAPDESSYARALLALLDLVDSPFSRQGVFALILNDAFLAAAGSSREDALVWLRWADGLHIFHSFDRNDKRARRYIDSDLYTWHQGLLRLRLGRIMDAGDEADGRFADYQGIVPFADIASDDAELVGRFSRIIETLAARLIPLKEERLSCAEWAAILRSLADDFVAVPRDRRNEEKVAYAFACSLETFAGYDRFLGAAAAAGVGFGFAREYARGVIENIQASHGKYLAGGVTVSPLLPMRPIPFRIVYVMGLGEGIFPGSAERSTLDLRHYHRRLGDVSLAEANRYLFLETLMSVRERLYLTYVSADTQKDEKIHPSSVVNELKGYLDDAVLIERFRTLKDAFPAWPDDMPLTGASLKYLVDPAPFASWSDVLVSYNRSDRLAALTELAAAGERALAKGLRRRELADAVARLGAWQALPAADEKGEPEPSGARHERVRIGELAAFLANPVVVSLGRHAGLVDDEEEDLLRTDDEPFYSIYPADYALTVKMAGTFIEGWQNGACRAAPGRFAHDYFDRYYAHARLRGETPEDAFGDVDCAKFRELVTGALLSDDGVLTFLKAHATWTFYRRMSVGETGASTAGVFAALTFKVKRGGLPVTVELRGELPFVWEDAKTGALETLILTKKKDAPKEILPRCLVRPLLFYLVLRAAGVDRRQSRPFTAFIVTRRGVGKGWRADVTPAAAKKYLAALVKDLLDERSFDLLPLGVVQKKDLDPAGLTARVTPAAAAEYVARLVEAIDAELEKDDYPAYTPGDLELAVDPAVPADAYRKVCRRITPLIRMLQGEGCDA